MRNLEQDAGAIAGVLLESVPPRCSKSTRMESASSRSLVRWRSPIDIGKRAYATCIVVEFGAIKALLLSGICLHRDPPLDIRQSIE